MACIWLDMKTEWKIKQNCDAQKASKAKKQHHLSILEMEQSCNPGSGCPCHGAGVSVLGLCVWCFKVPVLWFLREHPVNKQTVYRLQ